MTDKTAIEWTDATWNPIVGCSVVSKGCTNCYAMRTAGARTKYTAKYQGLTKPSKAGPVWTGEVRFWEKALTDPLRWREPRRVFVNSMGDLFAEEVPDEWIDRCFAVMALCPQHTFQILTKRPERMREYMLERWQPVPAQSFQLGTDTIDVPAEKGGHGRQEEVYQACEYIFERMPAMVDTENEVLWNDKDSLKSRDFAWPLPNVWLGTSCEDQATADARIPPLLETPAAIHFISAEPLLGPIDLQRIDPPDLGSQVNALTGEWTATRRDNPVTLDIMLPLGPKLDWVIVGGESGPNARPMHPDWARSLRDQCAAAGLPFFFKQWGAWAWAPDDLDYADALVWGDSQFGNPSFEHHSSGDTAFKVGKKAAGRILDGRVWNEFPEARP